MTGTGALTDDEFARLETLLDSPAMREAVLPPDAMQGFLCALAVGPDAPLSAEHAVKMTIGHDEQAPSPSAELVSLVGRFHDETVRALADGSFTPRLYALRRGRLDYVTWARGFLAGVDASASDWHGCADPAEVEEILFPIRVVADDLTDDERRAYRPSDWRRLVLDSERRLDDALRQIRDYWRIVRSPPQTLRRQGEKVGRNEACPCGSGRKFKHCHGR